MVLSLLLDANLPSSLAGRLGRLGISAVHVHVRGLSTAADETIIEHARERAEVLTTHDLDFSRILAASGMASPSVIVLRLRLPTATTLARVIETTVRRVESDLRAGAIVVVEDAAIRVRMLPVAAAR